MVTYTDDFLTSDEIAWILANDTVIQMQSFLSDINRKIRFSINLPESIRVKLQLSSAQSLPLMWISEDSSSHIDTGEEAFEETILVYLQEDGGSLIIGEESYEIKQNRCFRFPKGLEHRTEGSLGQPRLLIGPMSETGFPVGAPGIYYYAIYDDVYPTINYGNELYIDSYNYPTNGIISTSTTFPNAATIPPPFPGATLVSWAGRTPDGLGGYIDVSYNPGDEWINTGYSTFLYPLWSEQQRVMCFKEDTKILCLDPTDNMEKYIPIQKLHRGFLVKTSANGYQPICLIGYSKIYNPDNQLRSQNRLYECKKAKYPTLIDDLIITGCHSILVDDFTDKQRTETKELMGGIYVTEKKYRLMACLDERAEPYDKEGVFPIWHFALENEHERANYGVYANGLLVETSSIRMMRDYSGLTLL